MNIQQSPFKLIKILVLIGLFSFISCEDKPIEKIPLEITLKTSQGVELKTRLSVTPQQQTQGLSGVADQDFKDNDAMLFFNLESSLRTFWMPDTYFDLDIFFLNEDFKIIDVDRNVKHFIGREPYENIPRAKPVVARHVLELKASSSISKSMQVGDTIIWLSIPSAQQIESKIRLDR